MTLPHAPDLSIRCPHCGDLATPQGAQRDLLHAALSGRMRLAMVACTHCGHSIAVKAPQTAEVQPPTSSVAWRCPTLACTGWVCDIADVVGPGDLPLGCGECGAGWANEAALEADIRAIAQRFAHRRGVYRVTATRVSPVPAHRQPKRYDAQVWQECNGEAPG